MPLIECRPGALRAARRRRPGRDPRAAGLVRRSADRGGRPLEGGRARRDLEAQRARIDRALADSPRTPWPTSARRVAGSPARSTFLDAHRFRDRHVLIVVRGTDHIRDLRALRAYIEDVTRCSSGWMGEPTPSSARDCGQTSCSATWTRPARRPLRGGAELIVHAYSDGRAPGAERLRRLALPHTVLPSAGTSQDVAMLLAFEKGASLIVSVGAHFNLVEFLERRGRDVLDIPHPPADRRDAGGREGRQPPLPAAVVPGGRTTAAGRCSFRSASFCSQRPGSQSPPVPPLARLPDRRRLPGADRRSGRRRAPRPARAWAGIGRGELSTGAVKAVGAAALAAYAVCRRGRERWRVAGRRAGARARVHTSATCSTRGRGGPRRQ